MTNLLPVATCTIALLLDSAFTSTTASELGEPTARFEARYLEGGAAPS